MVIRSIPYSKPHIPILCSTSLIASVDTLLEEFWRLEEHDVAPEKYTQEGQCETLFCEGYVHDISGQFYVPFLFHQSVTDETFHESRAIAVSRFEHLEKKLRADNRFQKLYSDFMSESCR